MHTVFKHAKKLILNYAHGLCVLINYSAQFLSKDLAKIQEIFKQNKNKIDVQKHRYVSSNWFQNLNLQNLKIIQCRHSLGVKLRHCWKKQQTA